MPLQIVKQDITHMAVDAIVNTTNETMFGTSGVDGAVHRAAGPEFDAACMEMAPLGLGEAKLTPGYNLPAKYVIHTSGPVWQGGLCGESILLKSCYVESLQLALDNGCETVAFPLISSGTYGYPKDQVLRYAVQIISEFLVGHEMTVYLCVWDKTSYEFSRELYSDILDYLISGPVEKIEPHACCCFKSKLPELPKPQKGKSVKAAKAMQENVNEFLRFEELYNRAQPEKQDLAEFLQNTDKSFAQKLFDWIDAKGMTDVECYKKANVDRKTFSKIRSNLTTYRPSKQTAVAFAIALQLTYDETQELLASAGLTLSQSIPFDKIICFFIQRGIYDVFVINQALFEFDQTLLGV